MAADEMTRERPRREEPVEETDDEHRFVDELAGADDYWLTLTDAARITRRQEVTIRRWVTSGALPVRRQRMGLNKRTRHVRASDLAKLTPIIDPAATISGAEAHLDLVSIPAQQARIQATYQETLQHLSHLTQTLQTLEQAQHEREQQMREALSALRQEVVGYVQHLHQEQKRGAEDLTQTLRQQREWLESQLHHLATNWEGELAQRQAAERDLTEALRRLDAVLNRMQTTVQRLEEEQHAHLAQTTYQQQMLTDRLHEQQDKAAQMHHDVQRLENQLRWEANQRQELEVGMQRLVSQRKWDQRQQHHLLLAQRYQRRRHP